MKFRKLGLLNKNQKGVTLIEILIVVAITSIITAASGTAIFQVLTGNTRSNNHLTAVSQVQSAGSWISHDAHMAHSVNTTGSNGFPLTLSWSDWATNSNYKVVYSLVDNDISRDYSINGASTGNITLARYIEDSDPALTSCDYTNGKLTVKLTATVGSTSITRVYEAVPRPGR